MSSSESTNPRPKKRRMRRKVAVVAAAFLSFSGVAGASVLIQNFMAAEFTAGPPACLTKVAGVDTAFDAFDFTLGTRNVDNVDLLEEKITVAGLTGDRVVASEVYRIENNCATALDVSLVSGVQTGAWTQKHLEVWLGEVTAPAGYPDATSGDWDTSPLEFENPAIVNATTGVVSVPAGASVPVGMIASTGSTATGTDTATWVVQAELP